MVAGSGVDCRAQRTGSGVPSVQDPAEILVTGILESPVHDPPELAKKATMNPETFSTDTEAPIDPIQARLRMGRTYGLSMKGSFDCHSKACPVKQYQLRVRVHHRLTRGD